MGIRLPFTNFNDKKLRRNFEAIEKATLIRVMWDVQAFPVVGEPGTVIIYTVDNGAGKLKLMAQFPTGAAQQLSIEP